MLFCSLKSGISPYNSSPDLINETRKKLYTGGIRGYSSDYTHNSSQSQYGVMVGVKQGDSGQRSVLKSEFGHVWLLATLVYLLKLLYVNSCVVGGRIGRNLFHLVHCMCLDIFLQLFVRRIVP